MKDKKKNPKHRNYTRIDKNTKLELLKLTLIEGKTIYEASNKLKMNSATAKTIISHYKTKGKV